jgi:hypothetical protein
VIESLKFVTQVRINPLAQSIVITYKANLIASEAAQKQFATAIEQVAPPETSSPPSPVSQPDINQEVTGRVSPTSAVAEKFSVTPPVSVSVDEDPWSLNEKSDEQEIISSGKDVEPTHVQQTSALVVLPLSTAALAKRLGVTSQALTRQRSQPIFAEWSQAKDPERTAWTYEVSSKLFYPLEARSSQSEPLEAQQQRVEKLEDVAQEAASASCGEIVGGVLGEAVGGLLLGPEGAVIGEEMGALVGEVVGAVIEEEGKEAQLEEPVDNE